MTMNRWTMVFAAALLGILDVDRAALAGPPDPAHSFVGAHFVACPAGDSTFLVIARYFTGHPWIGYAVLDFSACPGFRFAPLTGGEPYGQDSTAHRMWMWLDPSGAAVFPVHGGGSCEGGFVKVLGCFRPWETGVELGRRPVTAFDQDSDLVVSPSDVAIVESKLGTSDPSADFDGDGVVTSQDLSIMNAHFGHHSESVTSVPFHEPLAITMSTPWPNPSRGETHFKLTLDGTDLVHVSVFDMNGRRIVDVFRGELGPGSYDFAWLARASDGSRPRAGMYFIEAEAAGRRLIRRAVLLRGS
jgi:hypothetical protein